METIEPFKTFAEADVNDTGPQDQHVWAHALLVKQEACQQSFQLFVEKCSGQQPSSLAMFQKFWARAMLLIDDWKELYKSKNQQLGQLTRKHEQLQHEHQVLKANLQSLKLTVQNMLGDVSALLQHTTNPDPANVHSTSCQQPEQLLPHPRQQPTPQQVPADGKGSSNNDFNVKQSSAAPGAQEHLLQLQACAASSKTAPRPSAQIVTSLICSIEKMSKQFADCQAGELAPPAECVSSRCRSSNSSGQTASCKQHPSGSSEHSRCSSALEEGTASMPALSSSRSSSSSSAASGTDSRSRQDSASYAAPRHPATETPAAAPNVHDGDKASQAVGQPADQLVSAASQRPSSRQSKSATYPAVDAAVPAAFVCAHPSWSHPPSGSKVVPSPATAQRHTLAWFLQNAGSPLTVSSSMPSPTTVTATGEPPGLTVGATAMTASARRQHRRPAGASAASSGTAGVAAADAAAEGANPQLAMLPGPTDAGVPGSCSNASVAVVLNWPKHAVTTRQAMETHRPPAAAEHSCQHVLSIEPSVSEWVGPYQEPSSAQIPSVGSTAGCSSTSSQHSNKKSSNPASLGHDAVNSKPGCGLVAAPAAAVSAPAAPGTASGRTASRTSGRSSCRSSSTCLTAMVRRRQQQQQDAISIYQCEEQAVMAGASRATSSMVAAAAAKLGVHLEQQQRMAQKRPGAGNNMAMLAGDIVHSDRSKAASTASVIVAPAGLGPLTAALNRQGSLGRTPAGTSSISRSAVPAAAANPGRSSAQSYPLRRSAQPRSTSSAVQQHKVRPGSAAAATAVPAAAKAGSRPSSSSGPRAQKQRAMAAVANSKGPQWESQQHPQPCQVTTEQTQQAAASHVPMLLAGIVPPALALPGSTVTEQKQTPYSPATSSSSELSDMVLLGSCASTTGWSNQTSPAYDTIASRRTSPADAAAAAAAGVSDLLPGQDTGVTGSTAGVVSRAASRLANVATGNGLRSSSSAARALDLLESSRQEHAAEETVPASDSGVESCGKVSVATPAAEAEAMIESTTTVASDVAADAMSNKVSVQRSSTSGADGAMGPCPSCRDAAGHPPSIQSQTPAATSTAPPAAVDTTADGSPAAVMTMAAGEMPDAVKLSNRADSPKKQPRKIASAAVADRGAGDGKRALQYPGMNTNQAATNQAQQQSSNRVMLGSPTPATKESAATPVTDAGDCQPSSPALPLASLSKRLRSSYDCHLLLQEQQQQAQQHVRGGQQLGPACATDGANDRPRAWRPGAAETTSVMAAASDEGFTEAGSAHGADAILKPAPSGLGDDYTGYDDAVAVTASAGSHLTPWQGDCPGHVDASSTQLCVVNSTLNTDESAAGGMSSRSLAADTYPLAAVHCCSSRAVTQLDSYPAAVSVETHLSISSDCSTAHSWAVGNQDSVNIGCSRLSAVSGPHQAAASVAYSAPANAAPARDGSLQQQAAVVGSCQAVNEVSASCRDTQLLREEVSNEYTDTSPARVAVHGSADTVAEAGEEDIFSLEELLPIVLDVMHSKKQVDQECDARHLSKLAPTHHLQRYIGQKVPTDQEQYAAALAMLLTSLDRHKEHQPEVAVYCRVLAGEVDEDYFHQHLLLRHHLQLLASDALVQEQQVPEPQLQQAAPYRSTSIMPLQHVEGILRQHCHQQQQQPCRYDVCCRELMSDAQLSWLLGVWGRQRSSVLARPKGASDMPQEERLHRDWWFAVNKHCGDDDAVRITASVVESLLLWELQQQVSCLASVVEAFKAADVANRGLLDLQQFQVFCSELNDTMSAGEVETLFVDELDKHGVGLVTFNSICRCLLPAM